MASRLFLVLTAWMPQMVSVGLVWISLFLTHVAPAQVNNDGAKPPRSYELGKKWLALQPELGKARMAQSDMRRALERLEENRLEAAADIASAKFGIALAALKNLGKVACDFDPFKSCKLAMSAAESLNEAWHCGERGSDQWKACIRGPVAYGSAWAGRGGEAAERIAGRVAASTEGAIALKDPSETLQAAQAGVEATGLKYSGAASGVIGGVKNYQDYTETNDLEGHVNKQFERSLRSASASMDKVESKIRELEQTAEATYTAYLSEKKKERAQQEKEFSEPDKKDASGDLKKDSASQAKDKGSKGKKEQWVELDDPDFPSSGGTSQRAQFNNGGGSQSASQGQSGKTIYYDPEVWRLGEEVPGVERPADHDKPKRKPSCHFKNTSCLNPFGEGREAQNAKEIRQDIEGAVRQGWHDPAIGEGYSLPPEDQMFASTVPSYGFPSEQTGSSQDQSSDHEPPSRNERPRPERYLVRCEGIFNDLQTRLQAATDLSLQVAASEGGGSVSAQIKQMMGQFPKGNGGGELVKQMVAMAGSEDRVITLTRQSISEWRGYLADLQRHQAKDYAISQQKYMTLITLGNEAMRVSEVTLEALDCYRANK